MRLSKLAIDTGLGLLVTVLSFGAVELALSLAGVEAAREMLPLSRGFDPDARYFVPHPKRPGVWRTQFQHPNVADSVIEEAKAGPRVLLFGGSNTRGFPGGVLEKWLDRGTSGLDFEVVNLGRPAYGSERVTYVLEQSLELLDPDVVVIYTGHNEFVERGFQMELDDQWSWPWMRSVVQVAQGTRTVRSIAALLENDASGEKLPEEWSEEYDKFADLTYDETLVYYEAYRQNLRRMCAAATERGVHVVLCTVVHNRFSLPYVSTLPPELTEDEIERFEALRGKALANLPRYMARLLPPSEQKRIHKFDFGRPGKTHPDGLLNPELPGMRECFGPLAKQDRMLPMDRPWHPRVRPFYEALELLHARDLGGKKPARLEAAEEALKAALEICPDHPRAHFELALLQLVLGRDEPEIVGHFESAARYDRAPRRGNGATNDIVREVASEFPEILLLDADRIFSERMPMGLVGWEWMVDHCHLNVGASRVLMLDIAQAIIAKWYG